MKPSGASARVRGSTPTACVGTLSTTIATLTIKKRQPSYQKSPDTSMKMTTLAVSQMMKASLK
eukprot:9911389-Karenia_brevis.AAC.1